jgi:hypothetical protein
MSSPATPGKPIQISGHAHFEMKRRGIVRAHVVQMIRNPGQILPSVKGRQIYQGLIGRARRLLLRVVVKEDAAAYHVVTAYKTSKIAKYWRTP